jgi:trimethylamine-N-oxide reductase (cytochrome c)
MVTNGFLAEIERVNVDELRRKYPEAFSRPFHPAAGPDTESFILGGNK